MATQTTLAKLSFDEYLEIERKAKTKSEYRGGEMFAMSGGTDVHARLAARMIVLLERFLGDRCQVYSSDLRVYAAAVNEAMYPDVSMICGEPEFRDGRRDALMNPNVVVEVLSPSTREYDLSHKAGFYRSLPSLHNLVLVDSSGHYVQQQIRRDAGWLLEEYTNPDQAIWILDRTSITLREIYDRILPFDPPPAS